MLDLEIVALCRGRDPAALEAMEEKYGAYCHRVAVNVLGSDHDAEECVNDAYLAVWNAIPPADPPRLLPYLAKTTRNIALHRLERERARKRDSRMDLVLDELAEVLPGGRDPADEAEGAALMEAVNDFLRHKAKKTERALFLRRYFWGDSIGDLRALTGFSESKIKSQLMRTRKRLRAYLEERGLLP